MAFFTTFGSFSIAAGILLIFLIFVMLAAERRGELGIARADRDAPRATSSEMFTFEGAAYDLVAAARRRAPRGGRRLRDGARDGAGVRRGGRGRGPPDRVRRHARGASLIAFALGVLLTLVVVAFSAWRVSVDDDRHGDPEPARAAGRAPAPRGSCSRSLGHRTRRPARSCRGVGRTRRRPLMLGVSLVLVEPRPAARALVGVPDRVAYTACGLAIVVAAACSRGAPGSPSSARSR